MFYPEPPKTNKSQGTNQCGVRYLARSFGKRPEELERANSKFIVSMVVLPGLAEADEAEGPARGSPDREVADHVLVVQLVPLPSTSFANQLSMCE